MQINRYILCLHLKTICKQNRKSYVFSVQKSGSHSPFIWIPVPEINQNLREIKRIWRTAAEDVEDESIAREVRSLHRRGSWSLIGFLWTQFLFPTFVYSFDWMNNSTYYPTNNHRITQYRFCACAVPVLCPSCAMPVHCAQYTGLECVLRIFYSKRKPILMHRFIYRFFRILQRFYPKRYQMLLFIEDFPWQIFRNPFWYRIILNAYFWIKIFEMILIIFQRRFSKKEFNSEGYLKCWMLL